MFNRTTNDGIAPSPPPVSRSGTRRDDHGDEVLAAVLIRMWTLASGRTLRSDVPPDQLSEEELIAFWADDMLPRAGRHAKADNTSSGSGASNLEQKTAGKAAQPRPKEPQSPREKGANDRQELSASPAAA